MSPRWGYCDWSFKHSRAPFKVVNCDLKKVVTICDNLKSRSTIPTVSRFPRAATHPAFPDRFINRVLNSASWSQKKSTDWGVVVTVES